MPFLMYPGPGGAPPRAAAALREGNLDGAALPRRHAAEEQRLAASPLTLAAATKPATEKRVAPAAARSPQLDLQRKLLGRPTHPGLPRTAPRHRPPPSVSTGRTAWTWSSGTGPKYLLSQLRVVSMPISQTSPGATTVRPRGA